MSYMYRIMHMSVSVYNWVSQHVSGGKCVQEASAHTCLYVLERKGRT